MSARFKGGLYGCGMISEYHLRAWQRIPEVEIVALCNRTLSTARQRREQFLPSARVYSDFREMLANESLDFVDILTPPALHAQHCRQAREAGLHVICQKPLTDDLATAKALVDEMEATSGRLFAVHENHRYRPWFQEILGRHKEGFFGQIHYVKIEHFEPQEPAEAYKQQLEQAVLLEYGTHLIDMMRALLGEPRQAFTRLHSVSSRIRGESLAHVTFAYPHSTAVVAAGWKPGGVRQGQVLVIGDKGEAFFEGSLTRAGASRFRLLQGQQVVKDEDRVALADYEESFYLFQLECVEAMRTGRPITQSGRENLKTLMATFDSYRSAQESRMVDLAPSDSTTGFSAC